MPHGSLGVRNIPFLEVSPFCVGRPFRCVAGGIDVHETHQPRPNTACTIKRLIRGILRIEDQIVPANGAVFRDHFDA